MNNLHIIVQAGGRGSRLRHHTWNKPKCLVSVRGKPLIEEARDHSELSARIYDSHLKAREEIGAWTALSDTAYVNKRNNVLNR